MILVSFIHQPTTKLFDQSFEHLNDVTIFSEVHLQEDVERLLPGQDSRVSRAIKRVVHEEEEIGFLQKNPL